MNLTDFVSFRSRLRALLLGLAMVVAACGQSSSTVGSSTSVDEFDVDDWDSVLAAAEGTTVRWYMWAGDDNLNQFVDDVYGERLEALGVELERVPIQDTEDAVNNVISETEAGEDDGSVDVIWINGANSATLADQDLLYQGWSKALPNAQFVDFENKAVTSDFGRDIGDAQSPWASAQIQLVHDSAKTENGDLPRTYEELATYACDNPGRVSYVDPSDFHGARFLNGALYELADDVDQFADFDEDTWATQSSILWDWLNTWESCLWREGKTYPEDEAALHNLLANGEVDFSLTLAAGGAAPQIEDETLPETAQGFVFDDWMVGDSSYVAIPVNASNPAGAMVLADVLLDPALQAQQLSPGAGGNGMAIDISKVTDEEDLEAVKQALGELPPGATPADRLADSLTSPGAADYQQRLGEDWRPNVVEN